MATRTIIEHIQRHDLGREIELFDMDLTLYGLGHKFLVKGDEGAPTGSVTFDGVVYEPWGIESSGWEVSANGTMPRPNFSITNLDGVFTTLITDNRDLKGCTITRIRTYSRYLDDGADPDPDQVLPLDVYEINRLTSLKNATVTWELCSLLDKQDVMLPGRQVLRDYCGHTYRRWTGSAFDYSEATCPYTGTSYFTANDASTTNANDKCGKRLASCKLRFGTGELPTRAFPGVARRRAR